MHGAMPLLPHMSPQYGVELTTGTINANYTYPNFISTCNTEIIHENKSSFLVVNYCILLEQ
jgi:microcystin-dependent protein